MKKYLLGLVAVLLSVIFVGTTAFTHNNSSSRTETTIYFDTNNAGTALDNVNGSTSASTYSCNSGTNNFCQKTFRYDDVDASNSQVEIVLGNYRLKSGVSVTNDNIGSIKKP
jgi:predicted nucleic acid binding AN1-type Zn finger protein